MRTILALLIMFMATSAAAQPSPCDPPWTSWGASTLACVSGRICEDSLGAQIEVLHVNDDTRQAYIRDLSKRYCLWQPPARGDVVWMTRKDFRKADCLLPVWMLEEVFAGYDPSCHEHSTVLVVKSGVLSLVTGK